MGIASLIIVAGLLSGSNIYADDGSGAWIGSGDLGGGGGPSSGGGSGGSSSVDCNSTDGSYLLECQGYSWIFYKSVVPANEAAEIKPVPYGHDVTIPATCAEHTGENGGFWHLGANARGITSGWYPGIAYFGGFTFVQGIDKKTYTYSTANGSYGHRETYNINYIKKAYPWAWEAGLYRTKVPKSNGQESNVTMSLNNAFYKNGKKIYQATKFSKEFKGEVWEDYKAAYKVANNGAEPTDFPGNLYAFCYWDGLNEHELTGKSINVVDNSSLSSVSNLGDKVAKASPNSEATITAGSNDEYKFKGWRENISDTEYSKTNAEHTIDGAKYTENSLKNDKTVYAVYAPYRTLSGIAVVDDERCTVLDKYNPGSVKVEHGEYAAISHRNIPNLKFEGWSDRQCRGEIINQGESYIVDPLTANITVYAVYTPDPLPCGASLAYLSSDCGSTFGIEQSKSSDSGWRTEDLYMKPGDTVYARGYFNPQYQSEKDRKPQKLAIAGNTFEDNINNRTIEDFLNAKLDPDWNNAFAIRYNGQSSSGAWGCNKSIFGVSGHNGEYGKEEVFSYKAQLGKEGKVKATTNQCNDVKNTPKNIKFSYDYEYNLQAEIDNGASESSEVKAYTPYNFINEISITNKEKDTIVYAGATKNVEYSMITKDKENQLVGATYHTAVENAKIKLQFIYNGAVYDTKPYKFDANNTNIPINIMDLPAGTTIHIKACVYPATSGEDWNWQDKEGDHEWACSSSRPFIVAKRPSFQVWGGGVYSNGNIAALDNTKNNLAGVPGYEYIASNSNNKVAFGSWAEQAVVANGAVKGLTSGAATGLNFAVDGNILNGIAENNNEDYCDRVPLSFANRTSQGCPNNGTATGYLGAKNNELDRKAFINYVIGDTNASVTKLTATNDDGSYSLNSDILNDASLIEKSRTEDGEEIDSNTRVVMVAGNNDDVMVAGTIVINSNLQYEDYKTYTGLSEIPKLIIYADNISIACNVTRIDAILIANNKVDTCPTNKDREGLKDGDPVLINNPENSTQLTINGMIITNQLDLNRTYGAATGINSGIPAEIINYDASTILWSMNQIDTDNYAGMSAVYQHEIAPRY